MGWFGNICSSIKSAASSVWEKAKDLGARAIDWMAENAENFVGNVKKVWSAVKPFLSHIQTAVRAAAKATATTWPWLSGALLLLDKGLDFLNNIESSSIWKKVSSAFDWAIKTAKNFYENRKNKNKNDKFTEEELREAQMHQENLNFAARESTSPEQKMAIEYASLINDYQIANTVLANTIDNGVTNFTHYLRLRATQKLLIMVESKFDAAKTIDDLSAEDIFLVHIASDLIKPDPTLSKEASIRLDRLLIDRYNKKLIPFIFEEMIASWAKQGDVAERKWKDLNKSYAKDQMLLKKLTIAKKLQGELDAAEEVQLEALNDNMPVIKRELDAMATEKRDIDRYVGAAEGFLQLLEKDPEEIQSEGREYLLEEGNHVGEILISCAQQSMKFSILEEHDQQLIIDYANIFYDDARFRMNSIMEVTA
jgi:hypothetical protein